MRPTPRAPCPPPPLGLTRELTASCAVPSLEQVIHQQHKAENAKNDVVRADAEIARAKDRASLFRPQPVPGRRWPAGVAARAIAQCVPLTARPSVPRSQTTPRSPRRSRARRTSSRSCTQTTMTSRASARRRSSRCAPPRPHLPQPHRRRPRPSHPHQPSRQPLPLEPVRRRCRLSSARPSRRPRTRAPGPVSPDRAVRFAPASRFLALPILSRPFLHPLPPLPLARLGYLLGCRNRTTVDRHDDFDDPHAPSPRGRRRARPVRAPQTLSRTRLTVASGADDCSLTTAEG